MRDGGGWTTAGTHAVFVCFSDELKHQDTVLGVEDGSFADRWTGTRRWKHQEVMSRRESVHQEQILPQHHFISASSRKKFTVFYGSVVEFPGSSALFTLCR